jgi:acyl carrier protein
MSTDGSDQAALRIARFIVDELEYSGSVSDLIGPTPVRLTEAIDSAALMELASFVEDAFDVQIQDDELVPENFATVPDLVRLLDEKGVLTAAPSADEEDQITSQP